VPPETDVVDGLTRALVRACRSLADAGRPQDAGRFAAEGWAVVRGAHPRQAQHLDGAMHHVARVEASLAATVPSHEEIIMPAEDRILDVRTEIPRRRHELIFEEFGRLPSGSAYVLVNDHDPKPLRYQLEAENAGEFSWAYLEEGPEVWRVRIGRVAPSASTATPA
jgi:uncharacterized protein (DUF2249 family)